MSEFFYFSLSRDLKEKFHLLKKPGETMRNGITYLLFLKNFDLSKHRKMWNHSSKLFTLNLFSYSPADLKKNCWKNMEKRLSFENISGIMNVVQALFKFSWFSQSGETELYGGETWRDDEESKDILIFFKI